MFGLSTEFTTKGKLATIKRIEAGVSSVSPLSERISSSSANAGNFSTRISLRWPINL